MTTIRAMRREDLPACRSKFTGQICEPEFAEAFSGAAWKPHFYVAHDYDAGCLVGMIGYDTSWLSYGIYNLFWVAVLPEFRGRGIAKQLVQRALDDLLPVADAIMLVTGIPDFYSKHWGFKAVDRLRNAEAAAHAGEAFGDFLMMLTNNVERGVA
jgi:GNAT superfamily N-acetyltransferase